MKKFSILVLMVFSLSLKNISMQTLPVDITASQIIERQIFKQIIKLPYYGVFDHISYRFDGETVTLSGKVTIARNRKDAQYAVGRVKGVANVVNNIEILPLSSFDYSIRIRLIRTFANRSGALFRQLQEPNPSVRIIVKGGHVTLEGYIANRSDYNLISIIANGVSDVFSVTNNLIVEKEVIR